MIFKNFLNNIWKKENKGIEGKNSGDGLQNNIQSNAPTTIIQNFYGTQFPEQQAQSILKKVDDNLEEIGRGNEDIDMSPVDSPDHIVDITTLLRDGVYGTNELATKINKIIPKIVLEKNARERREWIKAAKLLSEMNDREKRFIVWCYLIWLININISNLNALKINEVNQKYPAINHLRNSEMSIFVANGFAPNALVRSSLFEEGFGNVFTDEVLKTNGIVNKEDFFKKYPPLEIFRTHVPENIGVNVINGVPHIGGVFSKIGTILLNECGIVFN